MQRQSLSLQRRPAEVVIVTLAQAHILHCLILLTHYSVSPLNVFT